MTEVPKGHHGSAGIVPVFLAGEDVWRLHRFSTTHKVETEQLAAALLLRGVLRAWDAGQLHINIDTQ